MKFRNLLQLVFVLIAGQLMFACNSAKYYEFAASKQAPYKVTKQKPATEQVTEENMNLTTVALAAAIEKEEAKSQTEPVLEASTMTAVASIKAPKAINTVAPAEISSPEITITEAEALAMAKERVKNMTKAEKRELKNELKDVMKQSRSTSVSIVEIILAFLLPPLAVFLHDGIGSTFWISVLLTILFWIPGVIYALLVVTDTI